MSLVKETEKLNWWLKRMTNFCFDTPLKLEFDFCNLSYSNLLLQDIFCVGWVRVREIKSRLCQSVGDERAN